MSGQQIGTVVGGLIGAYFGAPQLGAAIGGYIGGVVDPTVIKGPSIGDAQQQTSLGGQPIPKFYGHCPPVAPTLIDGDGVARKIKVKSGGKGDTTQTEQEKFIATRAFLVGEGVAYAARITRNGKLVYSTQPGDDLDADSAAFAKKMTWYPGDESQGPDPSLEAIHGVGNTPYYRGRCYFVVRDDEEAGGAANQYRIEVIADGTQTTNCTSIYGDAIAYWPLDDAAPGGTAREVIAGRNGVYSSTLGVGSAPPLRAGSVASFKMTNGEDHMSASFSGSFSVVNLPAWSVACYLSLEEDDDHHSGSIIKNAATYWQSAQFGYHDWGLGLTTENKPYVDFSAGDTTGYRVAAVSPSTAAWVLGTYTRDDTVDPTLITFRVYVNGLLANTSIITATPGRVGSVMSVGGAFYPDSYGFIGRVSDVAVWNRAISADEAIGGFLSLSAHYQIPDLEGGIVGEDGLIRNVCSSQVAGSPVLWKDIVTDIAARANASLPAHLDIDIMTDVVPGFVLGNATLTGTEYIRALCTFYTVDLPEYDDQLHAIRRGRAVVATFDEDDLIAVEDEDNDLRSPAVKAYQRVTVIYPDPANQYVPTPQTSPRTSPDVSANNAVTLQCPIPFDADTMAQKADILQKIAFLPIEGTIKRAFPAEYSKYVQSDAFIFNDRRYLITKASNDDSMVTFEATYDRPSAYTSTASGSNAPAPRKHTSNIFGPSIVAAMNLPSLRSSDNVPGIYVGVCGLLDGWAGSDIYLSVDGGETEHVVATITDEATMGVLNADCDSGATYLIEVRIFHKHEVSSVSTAQIAARANAFAVVTDGIAEIGQFQTATETATVGTYDLTDLTRGELGTVAAAHAKEDRFVVLDSAVKFIPLDASYAGQTVIIRAVSRGTIPANNPTTTLVFDPPVVIIDGGEIT